MRNIPSIYQEDIFREVRNGSTDMLINASAGAGKSWVIKNCLKLIPTSKKVIILAFNKSIAEEMKSKVPSRIDCSTLHSLGMSTLRRSYKGIKVSEAKLFKFISPVVDNYIKKAKTECKGDKELLKKVPKAGRLKYIFKQLLDLYRVNVCENVSDIKPISDKYDIPLNDLELELFSVVVNRMNAYNSNPTQRGFQIDFTDMIFLPVHYRMKMPSYDYIMVDECQDVSKIQLSMIKSLKSSEGRFMLTGDNFQAIYGFAGSDSESFRNLENIPDIKKLPLSICYRCGTDIIKHVQYITPSIESYHENPTGEVVFEGDLEEVDSGDMILCRNTAPLVTLYMELLSKGVKSYIKGKDIGENLIRILKPHKTLHSNSALDRLEGDLDAYERSLKAKGIKNPKRSDEYAQMKEKIEICEVFLSQTPAVKSAISNISQIFQEEGDGVILSTIHKSKGLEADNVYIIRKDLIPSKYATQDWMIEQEKNLLYVAATRAIKKLTYVSNLNFSGLTPSNKDYNSVIQYNTRNLDKFWEKVCLNESN